MDSGSLGTNTGIPVATSSVYNLTIPSVQQQGWGGGTPFTSPTQPRTPSPYTTYGGSLPKAPGIPVRTTLPFVPNQPDTTQPTMTFGAALYRARQELVASFVVIIITGLMRSSAQVSDEFVCMIAGIIAMVLYTRLDHSTGSLHAAIITIFPTSKMAVVQLAGTLFAQCAGSLLGATLLMLVLPEDKLINTVPVLDPAYASWTSMLVILFGTVLIDDAYVCAASSKRTGNEPQTIPWLLGAIVFIVTTAIYPVVRYTGSFWSVLAFMLVSNHWDGWYWYIGADFIALAVGVALYWASKIRNKSKPF